MHCSYFSNVFFIFIFSGTSRRRTVNQDGTYGEEEHGQKDKENEKDLYSAREKEREREKGDRGSSRIADKDRGTERGADRGVEKDKSAPAGRVKRVSVASSSFVSSNAPPTSSSSSSSSSSSASYIPSLAPTLPLTEDVKFQVMRWCYFRVFSDILGHKIKLQGKIIAVSLWLARSLFYLYIHYLFVYSFFCVFCFFCLFFCLLVIY